MNCQKTQDKLYELIFELLEGEEQQEIEIHLESCEECQKAHTQALKEQGLLKEWSPPTAPDGLAEKTLAAARASKSDQAGGECQPIEPDLPWLGSSLFWRMAAAASLLLVMGVGVQSLVVSYREARPQEAFLYGPKELAPGLPAAYRVYVRNGKTALPVADAKVRVRLVSNAGRTILTADSRTDERGIIEVVPELPGDVPEDKYTIEVIAKSNYGRSELSQAVIVKRSFRMMVSTDKPLYQPGQTIHIRTLSLARADLRPVKDRQVVIEVQDAKGNKVFKKIGETSSFGIFSGDFVLADQVNMGSYTISAQIGDTYSERSVKVERYRLPKFKVSMTTEKGFYQPGEVVRGSLSVQYTFGKPVAGGRVALTAFEFIDRFRQFASFDGTTDQEGKFEFEIPLKTHFVGQQLKKGDALVTLEAAVVDLADHSQKKSLDLTVTTRPIRIELFPESGTLVQGVENILYLVTTYPDGRPAKTRLTIGATRQVTESSSSGIAKVKLTPKNQKLQLTVTAEDVRGVRSQVRRTLRIEQRSDAFLMRTDRAVYSTGDTAEITVLSPQATGRVFIDVIKERQAVLMKAIDIEDGKGALSLDLPSDFFGTLELHAYRIMSSGNIISDVKVIQVNRAGDLVIKAELDKDTYRPAEKALLNFLVQRSNGEPVSAALGLSGVDEAVFALQEMRPGLEKIYFMIQEEILKPRYEIHAHPPISAQQTAIPQPTPQPEFEEASVVLFSAAQGSAPVVPKASPNFVEKQQNFRRAKKAHFKQVATGVVLTPYVLFVLFTLPMLSYGPFKFFRREPLSGIPEGERSDLKLAGRRTLLWWAFGLYLPFGAALVAGIVGNAMRIRWDENLMLVAAIGAACFVLWKLISATRRVVRCEAIRALPLLKKVTRSLPYAYFFGFCAILSLIFGMESHPRLLNEGAGIGLFLSTLIICCVVVGGLSIAGTCAVQKVSNGRWLWLAFSRPVFTGLPCASLMIFPLMMTGGMRAADMRMMAEQKPALAPFMLPGGAGNEANLMEVSAAMEGEGAALPEETETSASGGQGLKAPSRIRRYFPETLLWLPELITDAAGRAQLEIPLADSITTWRLSMSAVSGTGELGSATKGLRVFQDFFVDIDFPVALTQHDRVSVPVAVYNYLEKPQTVRLEVQPQSWFKLLDEPTRIIELGAKEITSVYLSLEALKPGSHSLTVKAFGTEMADAVQRQVRIKPDGKAFVETINGNLEENLTKEIFIPNEAIDGSLDLLVKIYPGSFSQVMEGLEGIFRMPSGCFEQTSSSTYPNVMVLNYLRETNQIKPEIEMKALNYINVGYQRLLSYEVKGGGFEWFGQSPAHNVLTAYGLMEFNDMAKVFEVDPAVISRTRDWLYRQQKGDGSWVPTQGGIAEGAINQFRGATLRTTAYIAWALAESGKTNNRLERALDFIIQNSGSESDAYSLSLCVNALAAAGQKTEAGEILERLHALKQSKEKLVYWTAGSQGVTFSRGDVLSIETTALAAYAFMRSGRHVDSAHKALAWLIEQKDSLGTWSSTQATIHVMRALLAGSGNSGNVEGELDVTVAANGGLVKEIKISEETSDVFRLISLRDFVQQGKNTIALETAGKGSLAYQIVATHYQPWERESVDAGRQVLSIDVTYDTTSLKKDDTLTSRVNIRYNRAGVAPMTLVDLGIPPGFEVMPDAFEAMKSQGMIERFSITGRQVILYFREIHGGKPVSFSYQLRAKFPVKVKTPRSVVYQYYEPEVRDEAEPVELTVL